MKEDEEELFTQSRSGGGKHKYSPVHLSEPANENSSNNTATNENRHCMNGAAIINVKNAEVCNCCIKL